MDKQKFTEALVRCVKKRSSSPMFEAEFIGFYLEDTYLNSAVAVLPMNGTYYYCHLVPRSPMVLSSYGIPEAEIRRTWSEFWERVRSEYSKDEKCLCHFSGKDKTFNWNNGKVAIVVDNRIYVCKSENVDCEILREQGFTNDMNLFVPFSNGEAYYEPSADHGCNNCGLLSMC